MLTNKTPDYMVTLETLLDPSWYADSGATNHVTPEMYQLIEPKETI